MIKPIPKILIVDDSRIFRQSIEKALVEIGDFEIISSVWNGQKAIDLLKKGIIPDLITLDIEMPEMDGIETLKEIQKINKNLEDDLKISVLMVSSKTREGADITIQALELGAFDFIFKPSSDSAKENYDNLKKVLEKKLILFHEIKSKKFSKENISSLIQDKPNTQLINRNYKMIAIGISTGGPKLLLELLPELSNKISLPIVIAQHMPEGFTVSLAGHLDRKCDHKVVEAKHDMLIEENHIYLAPGNNHLIVKSENDNYYCSINRNPVENGYYPSINFLFRSVAGLYRENLIALIMTGMGSDGTSGLATVKRKGGYIIAQDEKSSTVWGMPKSAIDINLVNKVLDYREMPDYISKIIKK